MAFNSSFSFLLFFFLLATFVSCSVSCSISHDVFQSQESSGRALLETKRSCPVNFESFNYTMFTHQCKGPHYTAKGCCRAFKEFACPYAELLNDVVNGCASTMFTYINLHGKYPPGLFFRLCCEGKDGLACPSVAVQGKSAKDPA